MAISGVYLTEVNHAFAAKLIELIGDEAKMDVKHFNYEDCSTNHDTVRVEWEERLLREIESNKDISDTERQAVVKARCGQDKFRKNVMRLEKQCRVTGVTRLEHLRASHIKPWRNCSNARERLDGANGLLLTPTIDHLFDRGFISFEKSGEILVSETIDPDSIRLLGVDPCKPAGQFNCDQDEYLKYHREWVFLEARIRDQSP